LSENPQSPATHIIPQAFDLRPSRPLVTVPNTLLDLPDELMIDWRNTPPGSTASIYWPQLNAQDVLTLANQLYSSHLLSTAGANTLECTATKGITYIPIPPVSKGVTNFAGLFTVRLPTTIKDGQQFGIVVRRISSRQAPVIVETPVPTVRVRTTSVDVGRKSLTEPAPIPPTTPHRGPPFNYGRQTVGAFQVNIPVVHRSVMLRPEENTLAVMKWRLQEMSPLNRWYPVLQRYTTLIAGRVDGLGGNSESIPPSLHGARHRHGRNIIAVICDRFGDFVCVFCCRCC
jgi:hypothetical protein